MTIALVSTPYICQLPNDFHLNNSTCLHSGRIIDQLLEKSAGTNQTRLMSTIAQGFFTFLGNFFGTRLIQVDRKITSLLQVFPGANADTIVTRVRRGVSNTTLSDIATGGIKRTLNITSVEDESPRRAEKAANIGCKSLRASKYFPQRNKQEVKGQTLKQLRLPVHQTSYYFYEENGPGYLSVHMEFLYSRVQNQNRYEIQQEPRIYINWHVDRDDHDNSLLAFHDININQLNIFLSNASLVEARIREMINFQRQQALVTLQQCNSALEEGREDVSNIGLPTHIQRILNREVESNISILFSESSMLENYRLSIGSTTIYRFADSYGGRLTASIVPSLGSDAFHIGYTYQTDRESSHFELTSYEVPRLFNNWSSLLGRLREEVMIRRFLNTSTNTNFSCSSVNHSSRNRRSVSFLPTNPFLPNKAITHYTGELPAGEVLTVGGGISSHNGLFSLKLESSGRLVLYNQTGSDVLWSTRPNFLGNIQPYFVKMNSDGKLILYGKELKGNICKIWEKTSGANGAGVGLKVDDHGGIYFKDNAGKVIKRLCSSFLGGVCETQICNDRTQAVKMVSMLKNSWGSGVASLVIIKNLGGQCLTVTSASSSHGWFKVKPASIPPKKLMYFFHVKTAGTATGSQGVVTFNDRFRIGWSTPWLGGNRLEKISPANKITGEILKEGPSMRYNPIYYFEIDSHQYDYCGNPQNFDDDYGMTSNMKVKERYMHDELK